MTDAITTIPSSGLMNQSPLDQAVKEMFNEKKIDMITDLNDDEIKLITRINLIAEKKGLQAWKLAVLYYERLLLSRKRKSRGELLQAIEGSQKRGSFLERVGDLFKGGDKQK